jgi:Ribosomal protein L11
MAEVVEVLVPGGKATAGPPLGPAAWVPSVSTSKPLLMRLQKTASFNGMQVPVRVEVDDKKNFTISVGIPPTTALIMKEAGVEKGSGEPNTNIVGDMPLESAVTIAKMKLDDMLSYDLKNAVKEVIGTCVSLGITVSGKKPKDMLKEIDSGAHDAVLVG